MIDTKKHSKRKSKRKSKLRDSMAVMDTEVEVESDAGSSWVEPTSPEIGSNGNNNNKRPSPDTEYDIEAHRQTKSQRREYSSSSSASSFPHDAFVLPLTNEKMNFDKVVDQIKVLFKFGKDAVAARARMSAPGDTPPDTAPAGSPWVAFENPNTHKTEKLKILSPPMVILKTDLSCGPGKDYEGSYASAKHQLEFISDEHAFELYVRANSPSDISDEEIEAKKSELCKDALEMASRVRATRRTIADELWRYGYGSRAVKKLESGEIAEEDIDLSKGEKLLRCYTRYLTNAVMGESWNKDTKSMKERPYDDIDSKQQYDERHIKTRRGVWSKMQYAKKGVNITEMTKKSMEQEELLLEKPEFSGFKNESKTLDVQRRMFTGDSRSDCFFDPVVVIYPGLDPEDHTCRNPILSQCHHEVPYDEFPLNDGDIVQVEVSFKVTMPKSNNGPRVYVKQETIYLVHRQKKEDSQALKEEFAKRFEVKSVDVHNVMTVSSDKAAPKYQLPQGIKLAHATSIPRGVTSSITRRVIADRDSEKESDARLGDW